MVLTGTSGRHTVSSHIFSLFDDVVCTGNFCVRSPTCVDRPQQDLAGECCSSAVLYVLPPAEGKFEGGGPETAGWASAAALPLRGPARALANRGGLGRKEDYEVLEEERGFEELSLKDVREDSLTNKETKRAKMEASLPPDGACARGLVRKGRSDPKRGRRSTILFPSSTLYLL